MKPPIAMRSVAGTREWSSPRVRAPNASGSETTKFTTTASAPYGRATTGGRARRASGFRFGMKTYAEKTAPVTSAKGAIDVERDASLRGSWGSHSPCGVPPWAPTASTAHTLTSAHAPLRKRHASSAARTT